MASAATGKRLTQSVDSPLKALPQTADLRQVTVLSKDDYSRIQNLLKKQQLEKEAAQQAIQEKQAMLQRSKEIVENWDNTLQKKYQKKLEAHEKRLEQQEEERKRLDIEELKIQAEKRKKALEVAKKKQYFQTDRIKSFHSAYLLTEVLRERDAQVELRKLRASNPNTMEAYLTEQMQRQNEIALMKEREDAAKRIRQARQNAEDLKAQIQQHLQQKNSHSSSKTKEGEEIERLRLQFLLEKERLKQIELEEKKLLHEDYMQQIEDVRKMREIDRIRTEEEEEECRVFAAAKRKMMQMRAQREAEIATEKQAELDRIREKLVEQLSAIKSDEQERLDRAIQQAEEKYQHDEQAKKESRDSMLREMDMFRKAKEQQLSKNRTDEQASDGEMLRLRLEADRLFKLNELERRHRNRLEAQQVADYQLRQAGSIKDRTNAEKEAELRDAKLQDKVLDLEEEQFQKYVSIVVDDAKKEGEERLSPHPGCASASWIFWTRTAVAWPDKLSE